MIEITELSVLVDGRYAAYTAAGRRGAPVDPAVVEDRDPVRHGQRLALIVGLPLLVWAAIALVAGAPITLAYPELKGFNFDGGIYMRNSLVALWLALSIYTGAFIAENVRAGILSVSKGQTEAAKAVGLRRGQILRHVVLPQALRVILPPTGNQYLNLLKNTSLAVAVGMSDIVQVGTTVFNQTGRTLPVGAIWMLFYLSCSLTISVVVNWFNVRMQLVER